MILRILPGIGSSGILPYIVASILSLIRWKSGRLLWLHLLMMVPSFRSSNPGLLLIIVFSVVSSVEQKGYSAPVMSIQCAMAFSVLAVRQQNGMLCAVAYSYTPSISPKQPSSAFSKCGDISKKVQPFLLSTCSVMSSSLSIMLKSCIGGTQPSLICTVLLSTNVHVESGQLSRVNSFCSPFFSKMNVVENSGCFAPLGMVIPFFMLAPIW